jgi:DNA repair protein RadC
VQHWPPDMFRQSLEVLDDGGEVELVAHNHPSGDPTPSRSDVQMTQQIIAVASPLGISVHDHIIVGP